MMNFHHWRALFLSMLIVTLAQTAYIGAMQGWSYRNELVENEPLTYESSVPPGNGIDGLDLRLHLDPTNSSSYSGSGTNLADLSGFNNHGTIAAAGPTLERSYLR